MRQATLDNLLWGAGFCGSVVVTGIMLMKGRWRTFPAFTGLLASPALATLVLYPLTRHAYQALYRDVYYPFTVLDVLLQLGVIAEIARNVLRPTGTWVHDARKQFFLSGVAGTAVAGALAFMVRPPTSNHWGIFELRANLFSSLLMFELCVAVSLASNRLGLGWRSHVMAITQGLTLWSVIATVVNSLQSYYVGGRLYVYANDAQSFVVLATLIYWGVQLWKEEPERQPISQELRKFILALHQRVQYDLGEAER